MCLLNPSLTVSVMYETSVMKLNGGGVEKGKVVQECNFENDAVKIAL